MTRSKAGHQAEALGARIALRADDVEEFVEPEGQPWVRIGGKAFGLAHQPFPSAAARLARVATVFQLRMVILVPIRFSTWSFDSEMRVP